ncbi:glycoside hydrolase family 2 protein [Niveibacterium sp. SC-1]|uniref:glycoside hydrolase family 2 protein n=1 Tax=Niveibacterium sp. SC-1 TaxID=3135646 RepID=UPI00311FC83C
MHPHSVMPLDSGWQFRATGPDFVPEGDAKVAGDWQSASVPGTVYQDLIASGSIPDPYYGLNEQKVQWIAHADWCYRLDFKLDADALSKPDAPFADLVFEGLDTFATVWLNNVRVLESDNMFVPARVPVAYLLREGSNRLEIRFDSALRRGREREALFGKRHLWNGDSSRLYVRKAQYHYGWDWGPVLLTAGPWKPISLQRYAVRIEALESRVHLDGAEARVEANAALAGQTDGCEIEYRLLDPHGAECARAQLPAGRVACLTVKDAQRWWPAGHGFQPLYRLEARVLAGEQELARETQRLGLRSIRLVQEAVAGEGGRSFHFEVNGKAIFIGGSNWIPDDNLLNRISPERYRERVRQAVDGNQVMLRVWAGGIYEDDAFYDACDELGVLVWQDFLFACGMYPAHPAFLASVRAEAEAAVRRLRHRASLAIWCGNNEDYAIAETIGQHGPGKDMARFDARAIYEQLLPEVCAALDPERAYWPGSPYSPSATGTLVSSDSSVGDRHSWEVWHGAMLPYQDYHKVQARFVSEFGMQAHPSLAVLESVIPEDDRHPASRTVTWHNKAAAGDFPDGHRRLAVYLADTLRVGPTLADSVYATQFVQAEAMRYAYQDFRRRWQHAGARAVGGALVWQLNDCWPVTSWAIIDSAGCRKPAWFSIRRALAPLAVAVRLRDGEVLGWVMNQDEVAPALRVALEVQTFEGVVRHAAEQAVVARANGATEFRFPLPPHSPELIARVRLLDEGSSLIVEDTAWPEPFRFYELPRAQLTITPGAHAGTLRLATDKPLKGLWLGAPSGTLDDNFLDLLPGHPREIAITGDITRIRARGLNLPETDIALA